MRLLHTSDWHLGQTFYNYDRTYEHRRFLDWLLDTIEDEAVDALLVAGDVFDNANPAASAQRQLFRFLTQAKTRSPRLEIVLTAGNHDSPGRLEAPAPLLELMDAAVVGQVRGGPDGGIDLSRLVVPLRRDDGAVAAWCLAVPFLRPGDLPRAGAEDGYGEGVERLYAQVLDEALRRRRPGQALVAMGHCHVLGGRASEESERRVVVGGAEALPAGLFDPAIAYVALGHLHLAQSLQGPPLVCYPGSPLPMSFSEADYPHQVVCLELQGESVASTRPIRVPRFVDLFRVPEEPLPLERVLASLERLELADRPEEERPYLQVQVRLDGPEPGLRARVEAALEGKPVRLARIEAVSLRGENQTPAEPISLDDLGRLSPEEIFRRLHRDRHGADAPPDLLAALSELLNCPEAQEEDAP